MSLVPKSENESYIYGVDYQGRVWFVNSGGGGKGSRLCWGQLPNSSRISLKRVVSSHNILWGISSDHQIYVYVPRRDIPVRIREEIYENQRWNPVEGFCDSLLPTDRPKFSNEEGTEERNPKMKLPCESWGWEGDWQIENTFENELVADGWTYAVDFPASYQPTKSWKSCVRRRKLYRYRRYIGTNQWNLIEPLQADHTAEPFIDVAVGTHSAGGENIYCLWAITVLGNVYFRSNVKATNPEGSKWEPVQIKSGYEACQMTLAKCGVPFVVTWSGSFLYRTGVSPVALTGLDWMEGKGPPGGLMQLSAGFNCLWAITRDKKCWALKGNLNELLVESEPVFEWIEIPGRMKSISVGKTDKIILALAEDELETLYIRFGISDEQKTGQGWKEALPDVEYDFFDNVSVKSLTPSLDTTDGNESGDTSLNIDNPNSAQFPMCNTFQQHGGQFPSGFSWVDGACASCIRSETESDLEVGPWREEILQNLQKLKVDEKEFDYPSAIESASTTWTKSVPAHMRRVSRKSGWIKGFLEISNNNKLMFQDSRGKQSWACPLDDVLSCLGGIEGASYLTLRVRQAVDLGVAEYISFKFIHEKDADEWNNVINELDTKKQDEMILANVWLATRSGEIHTAGLMKMLDIPTDADIIEIEPSSGVKMHCPLNKGFHIGSVIQIDISIPNGADRFIFDLKGQNNVTALHFNPRLADGIVVRNSCVDGEWGTEERDGACSFRAGQEYTIFLQCTQTHILVNAMENKRKTTYSFEHRVPIRTICNLFIFGDVDVKKLSYEPKISDSNYQVEFVTSPVPGHFWKVAAASNGSVWAIGYDFNVWCLTSPSKSLKTERQNYGPVEDERVFFIYENQRWNPINGFGAHGLPTDRHNWTDETGRIRLEKDDIRLPSAKWTWVKEWEIDYDVKGGVDESGWQYAIDFPATYHSNKRINDFVRRRRWKRVCKFLSSGPWKQIPDVKLVDLCIQMNEDCEWEVAGLTPDGDAIVRSGINPDCLMGDRWDSMSNEKPFISLAGWYGQNTWAVGKDGFAYIRYGSAWQLLDRPLEGPLRSVTVGPSGVWAVSTNNGLYRRSDIQQTFPEGREWVKICDNVIQAIAAPDGSLWALLKVGDIYRCTISKRMAISHNSPGGLGWDHVADGPWRCVTLSGSFKRGSTRE